MTSQTRLYPALHWGDEVFVPHLQQAGQVRLLDGLSVEIMLHNRTYIQTSRKSIQLMEDTMAAKKKEKTKELRIAITIVGDGYLKRCAVLAERDGLCYLRTFDHIEGQTDWNEQVKAASDGLTQIEIAPPPDIQTTPDDVVGKATPNIPAAPLQADVPAGYKDWEPPDTDMPWEAYPVYYVETSKPVIGLPEPAKVAVSESLNLPTARPILTLENPPTIPQQQALF